MGESLKTRPFCDIKKDLMNTGWKEADIDEEFNELTGKKKIGIGKMVLIIFSCLIILGIIICAFLYYYFFISPNLIEKPIIIKPPIVIETNQSSVLSNGSIIVNDNFGLGHLEFLLNEIEVYKLHSNPSGEIPRIKFIISDTKQEYYLGVINHKIVEINESNPDIILRAEKNIIISVYNANNTKEKVMDSYNQELLSVEILANTETLVSKGYISLYNYFGMTGNAIAENLGIKGQGIAALLIVLIILLGIIFIRVFHQRKV